VDELEGAYLLYRVLCGVGMGMGIMRMESESKQEARGKHSKGKAIA
jgi:hypothetical protein